MSFVLSTIISGFAHFFTGFLSKVLTSDEGKQVEAGIIAFIKTDVGTAALDAIQYAAVTLPGATNDAARAAAVAKLKADLVKAGKDAKTLTTSSLNLFIEMAYTYASGTIGNITTSTLTAKG